MHITFYNIGYYAYFLTFTTSLLMENEISIPLLRFKNGKRKHSLIYERCYTSSCPLRCVVNSAYEYIYARTLLIKFYLL